MSASSMREPNSALRSWRCRFTTFAFAQTLRQRSHNRSRESIVPSLITERELAEASVEDFLELGPNRNAAFLPVLRCAGEDDQTFAHFGSPLRPGGVKRLL